MFLTFINFIIHKLFRSNILWDFVFCILKYRSRENKIFVTPSRFISSRYKHYSFYRNTYVAYIRNIYIYICIYILKRNLFIRFILSTVSSIFFHKKNYLKSVINFYFFWFAKHLIFDHCAKQTLCKRIKKN